MKRHGRAAAVLTAAALCVGMLGGCARLTGDYLNSPKNRRHAIEVMNEQYDTEFTYIEDKSFQLGSGDVFGGHSGVAAYIYVECDEAPGKKITVYANDGGSVSSDYIMKLYEDETIDALKQIAESVYDGEVGVFLDDEILSADFDEDTTIEDLFSSGVLHYISFCTTDTEQEKEKYKKLVDTLILNKVNCLPYVYTYTKDVYSHGEDDMFNIDNEYGIGVSRPETFQNTLDEGYEYTYQYYEYFFSSHRIDSETDSESEKGNDAENAE